MQWRVYLDQLSAEDTATLVNHLTIGFGTLALLVRRVARGVAAHEYQQEMVRVEARLLRVVEQLGQAIAPDEPAMAFVPVERHARPGARGLRLGGDIRARDDGHGVRAQLQSILVDAQHAGELMTTDAPVAEILRYLRAALIGLHALRHGLAPEADDVASP